MGEKELVRDLSKKIYDVIHESKLSNGGVVGILECIKLNLIFNEKLVSIDGQFGMRKGE